MSDDTKSNTSSNASVNPATGAVTAFWTQWMEQSSRDTQALLELLQEAGDPEQVQRRWLEAVAQSLDRFMRSPEFLETMKQHLKTITERKRVQDQDVQGTARQHGMPLADDITGLLAAQQHQANDLGSAAGHRGPIQGHRARALIVEPTD